MPSYDRALNALRSWLDSWTGLGTIVTGMERQGYDVSLTRYPEGWRATFIRRDHTSRPRVGQVLRFHATPWRAVQVAARDALRTADGERSLTTLVRVPPHSRSGSKDDSCGNGSSFRELHWREAVAYWTRGFITAYNWFNSTDQVTRELSNATIIAYIDKFCRDFPLKDVPQATASLICEAREAAAQPSQFCEPVDPRGPKGK
jgi:hypothetical protein